MPDCLFELVGVKGNLGSFEMLLCTQILQKKSVTALFYQIYVDRFHQLQNTRTTSNPEHIETHFRQMFGLLDAKTFRFRALAGLCFDKRRHRLIIYWKLRTS